MKNNKNIILCEKMTIKKCQDCDKRFINDRWCGELLCSNCLKICEIIDDPLLSDKLFFCCEKHRPIITPLLIEFECKNNENSQNSPFKCKKFKIKSSSFVDNIFKSLRDITRLDNNQNKF